MISWGLRFCYLFAGLTPMAFGLFCRDITSLRELMERLFFAVVVVVIGCGLLWFFLQEAKKFGASPKKIKPVAVSRCRLMGAGYVMTYITPFVLTTNASFGVVVVAFGLIFLMSFWDSSLGYNPLAKFMGYDFYQITTESGISMLVVSKMSLKALREGFNPVNVTEDFKLAYKDEKC